MKKVVSMILIFAVICASLVFTTVTASATSYSPSAAVDYASRYWNNYNPAYRNYNSVGGDCANFVSQCLYAGGLPQDGVWYNGSSAWINCSSQINYFRSMGYKVIDYAQAGDIQVGNPVYYYNGNSMAHTAICIGFSDNGTPLVAAHNKNHWGSEWTLGGASWWGGSTRRVTILIGNNPICTCSDSYAGDYIVNTNSLPLTMRSGHGTGYSEITSIPKGSQVYVSKSDGSWAHIEWNGYKGYCSMAYLRKIENKNFRLHVWVSNTGMGDVPSDFYLDNRYYICYELIDETTGKRAKETSSISFRATETIRNTKGVVYEHTYENSDNNWISFVPNSEDTYTGTVTISGDVGVSSTVSFNVWANAYPQIKAWAWEGDETNEISTIGVGKTAYLSYLIRDKNTGKGLNEATRYWLQGNGYTVTLEVYNAGGTLLHSKSYKNNDSAWIAFQPSSLGEYKLITKVTGNLTGSSSKTFKAEEKEHAYGIWQIAKSATCTLNGTRERECIFCGHKDTMSIPATGHSYGSWTTTKAATCTASGTKTRTCSTCGNKETQTISATGHSYTATVVAPTNTEKGYTLHKCSVCGDSYKDNYTDALKPIDTNALQIVVDSKAASPGSTVEVNISLKNNPGIATASMNLVYDKNSLTLNEITAGDKGKSFDTDFDIESGNLLFNNYENVKGDGALANLKFKINEKAKTGTYEVKLNKVSFYNEDEKTVPFESVNSIITVSDVMYGDATGDGKIDMLDVLRLRKYLVKFNHSTNTSPIQISGGADANGDGKIDMLDVLRLRKYLVKFNHETGISPIKLGP